MSGGDEESGGGSRSQPRSRDERIRSRTVDSRPAGVSIRDPSLHGGVSREAAAESAAAWSAEHDEAVDWGKIGRIGVYSCNFGTLQTRPGEAPGTANAFAELSSLFIMVQESTTQLHNYLQATHLLSDRRYAVSRNENGDGLMIAAMPSQVASLETHTAHSGSQGPQNERSSHLFATGIFKWGIAGVGRLTVMTFHMHRELAKRSIGSPYMAHWARDVAAGIRACGARVMAGDANMAVWAMTEIFAMHTGLVVQLVAHHREVGIQEPVNLMDARGVQQALRHDSMGIWIIGPVNAVHCLSLETQCLAGALHPACMSMDGPRFKLFHRGYPFRSFTRPADDSPYYARACGVPSNECLHQVVDLWNSHQMTRTEAQRREWTWNIDPGLIASAEWVSVATALPRRGEEWAVLFTNMQL